MFCLVRHWCALFYRVATVRSVMCGGELRSAYTFLFGKSEEKRALGKPGIVKQMCVRKWIAFIWLRTGSSKGKPVPLHAMEALGGRGGIAPTHYRPRH
jgi:hypothetical protein